MDALTTATIDRQKAGKVYVRITFLDHTGKKFRWWAQKLGAENFRRVSREGVWGEDRTDHYFLGTVETEVPAAINLTYGQLETETEKF